MFLATALGEVGLDLDDVEISILGEGGPSVAAALESGEFAAYGGAISDFAAFRAEGLELRDLTPEGLASIPAASVTVSEDVLEANREALVAFLQATAKGIYLGQVRPEIVEEISRLGAPADWRDEKLGAALLESTIESTKPANLDRIGEVDPARWQSAEDQLIDVGELAEPVDLDTILVTDLVEEINDFDRAEVERIADEWMAEHGG